MTRHMEDNGLEVAETVAILEQPVERRSVAGKVGIDLEQGAENPLLIERPIPICPPRRQRTDDRHGHAFRAASQPPAHYP